MAKDQEERLIAAINLNTWMTSRKILLDFYTTDLNNLPDRNIRNAVNLVADVNHVIDRIESIYKTGDEE